MSGDHNTEGVGAEGHLCRKGTLSFVLRQRKTNPRNVKMHIRRSKRLRMGRSRTRSKIRCGRTTSDEAELDANNPKNYMTKVFQTRRWIVRRVTAKILILKIE